MSPKINNLLAFAMALTVAILLSKCGGDSSTGTGPSAPDDGRIIVKNELRDSAVHVRVTFPDGGVKETSVDPGQQKDVTDVLPGGMKVIVRLLSNVKEPESGVRSRELELTVDGNRLIKVIGPGPRGAADALEILVT